MKYVLSLIILCSLLSCFSRYDNPVVSSEPDIDVYAFLDMVLSDTSVLGRYSHRHGKVISDVEMLPPHINTGTQTFAEYLSEVLSEADTLSICLQIKSSSKFRTDSLAKYGYLIARVSDFRDQEMEGQNFWSIVYKKYGKGFITISKPIFNKQLNKAYFRIGYSCGRLCGGGVDVLLEKNDAAWVVKETLSGWGS